MNQYQTLRQVRSITGHRVALRSHEAVNTATFSPDRVVVLIDRVLAEETRWGLRIKKRGAELHTFIRNAASGAWEKVAAEPVWWSTDELVTSAVRKSPEEDAAHRAWEDDCYRPGTAQNPLDNVARREQGYNY